MDKTPLTARAPEKEELHGLLTAMCLQKKKAK